MFGKIASFEFRYQLRQVVFWVAVVIFALLGSLVLAATVAAADPTATPTPTPTETPVPPTPTPTPTETPTPVPTATPTPTPTALPWWYRYYQYRG